MIDILRKSSLDRLVRGLDVAVGAARHLEVVRDGILSPLLQLRALSTEVEGVFAQHPRSVERLTLMLSSHTGAIVRSSTTPPDDAERPPDNSRAGCRPGIMHMGRLVLLGLAAGRVGDLLGNGRAFVQTVFGLASMGLPAEQIESMVAAGLEPSQLRTMLEGLHAEESGAALCYAQVRTFLDRESQNRRACLLAHEQAVIDHARGWSSSTSAPITAVKRSKAKGGDKLLVSVTEADDGGDADGWSVTLQEIDDGVAAVVLASDDALPIRLPLGPKCLSRKNTLTVTLPPDARAGWLGLTSRSLGEAVMRRRQEIRAFWEEQNRYGCLRYTPVDLDVIAPCSDTDPEALPVSIPKQTSEAAWGVRILDIAVGAQSDGAPVSSGSVPVTAWLGPADDLTQAKVEVEGTSFVMPVRNGVATAGVPIGYLTDGARLFVTAWWSTRAQPDDRRKVELNRLSQDATGQGSEPLAQRYVLLRPSLATGSSDGFAEGSIRRVGFDEIEARRLELERLRPAWVETDLPWVAREALALPRPILDAYDRTADWLLQQIERLAARCPGFEDAVWIAIVPRSAKTPSFLRSASTCTCAGMVIATPEAFTTERLPSPARTQVERRRARMVGHLDGDGPVLVDPIRFEVRPAGEGAENLTEFVAVARGLDGGERSAQRVATMSPSRTGSFACLLPADDDVTSIEIVHRPRALAVEVSAAPSTVTVDLRGVGRRVINEMNPTRRWNNGRALPAISRIERAPVLDDLRLDGNVLRWRYSHPIGYRSHVSIEVGAEDGSEGWAPVAMLSASYAQMHLDLGELSSAVSVDRIRVVASDGWNSTTAELDRHFESSGLVTPRVDVHDGSRTPPSLSPKGN